MKTVCVDLDGVLAKHDGWKGDAVIGEPVSGAVRFTRALGDFARVLIHTSRSELAPVEEWLAKHAFHFDAIWSEEGKPIAAAYVDDRAVLCRPEKDPENYDFDRALRMCRALVSGKELGSQGSYSHGKLNEDDEGDLQLMVSRQGGCVRMDFGKPVAWIGLPKQQAIEFARILLKRAREL